jgi:hypothetical protein
MEPRPPGLEQRIQVLRNLPWRDISDLASQEIPEDKIPVAYLAGLNEKDRILCLRASLICLEVTGGAQIPREMQLRAVVADQNGGDSLISAGTGSGKTLPIALNFLLDDPSLEPVTLTISPLKRLQSTQANDFTKKYNVPTLTINEDTPRDDTWWDVSHSNFVFKTFTVYTVRSGKCLQSQD